MFRFEDEPHDDGSCVREAVESMVGEIVDVAMPSPVKTRGLETVRMEIVQAYPAFFIGRRVGGSRRGLVLSVRYADISSGACVSEKISTAVRRVEAARNGSQGHASLDRHAARVDSLID